MRTGILMVGPRGYLGAAKKSLEPMGYEDFLRPGEIAVNNKHPPIPLTANIFRDFSFEKPSGGDKIIQ